ncbi:hypothetical protein Gotur_027797 [Gossypium turneri]
MMRLSSCFTLIMGTYRIYLILGWMNNCFGPLLNIGTLHIAVLLFGRVDLVPTVEKYTALLRCPRFQVDEAYSRAAALGHVDEAVSDLFDQLDKGVTPGPAILAETFRSLNTCRRASEGRFIGMLSGELLGGFLTEFFTDAGALIGFRCLEFGEPLGVHLCLY